MPCQLAEALIRRLIRRRLLFPSLLEVFKCSIEEIDLRGESSVDAEWMAYLGAFRYLHSLSVADCHRINSSALWSIAGLPSLREVDLSRCLKVTDAGIRHLLSIPTLETLCISETGVTTDGVKLLSSLTNLSVLDLGGLPVTDVALDSLQVLTGLQYLDLWGSEVSDKGVSILKLFPKLSFLNLAWTKVTKLPNLSNLASLNMSNCSICSIFEEDGDNAPLVRLILSGATMMDVSQAFLHIELNLISFLDLSNASLHQFSFLAYMIALEHLDLSDTLMGDDSVKNIAFIGSNLKYLNLSRTKVTAAGVGILVGHVPKLETILLACTPTDDCAISYLGMMPSLKAINICNTKIKGLIHQEGAEPDFVPSLIALQNLCYLERLEMEEVYIKDEALCPLSGVQGLSYLSLRSGSVTDMSLYNLSSVQKLIDLSIHDAVLTNAGLNSFNPPAMLQVLDLRGCWLLTKEALLSFCQQHPSIEVRHELVHVLPFEQDNTNHPSSSGVATRTLRLKQQRKLPTSSLGMEKHTFVDQRLKYSREELLALQFSSVSLGFSYRRVLPTTLMFHRIYAQKKKNIIGKANWLGF